MPPVRTERTGRSGAESLSYGTMQHALTEHGEVVHAEPSAMEVFGDENVNPYDAPSAASGSEKKVNGVAKRSRRKGVQATLGHPVTKNYAAMECKNEDLVPAVKECQWMFHGLQCSSSNHEASECPTGRKCVAPLGSNESVATHIKEHHEGGTSCDGLIKKQCQWPDCKSKPIPRKDLPRHLRDHQDIGKRCCLWCGKKTRQCDYHTYHGSAEKCEHRIEVLSKISTSNDLDALEDLIRVLLARGGNIDYIAAALSVIGCSAEKISFLRIHFGSTDSQALGMQSLTAAGPPPPPPPPPSVGFSAPHPGSHFSGQLAFDATVSVVPHLPQQEIIPPVFQPRFGAAYPSAEISAFADERSGFGQAAHLDPLPEDMAWYPAPAGTLTGPSNTGIAPPDEYGNSDSSLWFQQFWDSAGGRGYDESSSSSDAVQSFEPVSPPSTAFP